MDQHSIDQLNRIYRRNNFTSNDIEYVIHTNQRTYFHLCDGRKIMSTMPLKSVLTCLPDLDFWSIQKGIVVAIRCVESISDDFVYTMISGTTFQGRSRNPAEHKRRRRLLHYPPPQIQAPAPKPTPSEISLQDQCRILDHASVAFAVIELIFSDDGRGIDFIFRYCNQEMADLDRVPVEDMLNHSFYEVFPQADRKWIVPYADVAINGTRRVLHKYSPERSRKLVIRCFQPKPGFCACLITTDE